MKEFFITVLFTVVFLGGIILVAISPIIIRRMVKGSQRKKRHQGFQGAMELWEKEGDQVFDLCVRLYKEDLLKLTALERRFQYPWYSKLLITLFFGWWVIGGSMLAWDIITGQEPKTFFNWARALLGILIGLRMLWMVWVAGWLVKKSIESASDMQISHDSSTDYRITPEGITISLDGVEVAKPEWSEVDRVEEDPDGLRIMSTTNDFMWIPKDALFRSGNWASLRSFLEPLMKGENEG